jgi:hypothetical protein
MYQNVPFLNHFFAFLDFGSRGEERRTKGERRGRVKDRSGENEWFWGFFYCTCLTTDFTDLSAYGGQAQILFTAENAKDAREVPASLVFSANSAFKASFAAKLRLRPPRFVVQLRRAGKVNCVVLIHKLADGSEAGWGFLHRDISI